MISDTLKRKIYSIIFEANTPGGKAFDVALLIAILTSVFIVIMESVEDYDVRYHTFFVSIEWAFTVIFTLEYIVRILITSKRKKYIFSFYGIIDLLSILPAYMSLVFTGLHSLAILRSFRLIRVFRIFKLARFIGEASHLAQAMKASRHKITVFIVTVGIIVVIMGTVMYMVEGAENGFTSIPKSIYWAIVTLTTVGYGDLAPGTVLGQTLASIIMIMGYGIIAVPTGIFTAEWVNVQQKGKGKPEPCTGCGANILDNDASFCKFCGTELD
jgi:voltage-gated potassium channel